MLKYLIALIFCFTLPALAAVATVERADLPLPIGATTFTLDTGQLEPDTYLRVKFTGTEYKSFIGSSTTGGGYVIDYGPGYALYEIPDGVAQALTITLTKTVELSDSFTVWPDEAIMPTSVKKYDQALTVVVEAIDSLAVEGATQYVTATPNGENIDADLSTEFTIQTQADLYLRGKLPYTLNVSGLLHGESLTVGDYELENGENSARLWRIGRTPVALNGAQAPYDDREVSVTVHYRGEEVAKVALFDINRLEAQATATVLSAATAHRFINNGTEEAMLRVSVDGAPLEDVGLIPAGEHLDAGPFLGGFATFYAEAWAKDIKAASYSYEAGQLLDVTELEVVEK